MITKLKAPFWAVLEYGWYPLLVFMATPFLLHTLGAEVFGYWMLLTAIVGFGTVLNTGTSAAIIKQVSASRGCEKGETVKTIISTSLTIALIGGGLLAIFIILVFGLARDVFFDKMGNSSLVLLTGSVAAIFTWVEQVDNVFASALKGAEKFAVAAKIEMFSKAIQMLGVVIAVYVWGTLIALYVALMIVIVMRVVAKSWIVSQQFGIKVLSPSFVNISDVVDYAKWGWLQGVGGLLFGVMDRLLVGSLLGASSLAHYSIATQLAMQIHAFSAAGFSVIFPKISRKLHGGGIDSNLVNITKLAMIGNFIISSILSLGLLIFGEKILILWLGGEDANASLYVLRYLTIAYWLLAINVVPHFILLAINRVRFVAVSNILAGIVSLVIMYLLVQQYGIDGVGIARVIYGVITLINFISLFEYFRSLNK